MQYIDDSAVILTQLINNKSYYKRIMHHLNKDYFDFVLDKKIFSFIKNYSEKYLEAPSPLILKNALSKLDLNVDEHVQYVDEFVELVEKAEIIPLDPMLDKTEEYVKEMELKNAITKTFNIYKGDDNTPLDAIPEILKTALAKSIEDSHGVFYFEEEAILKRREAYNNPETKLPFKIGMCNQVTNNGVMKKALHCLVAGPNVGKTAWLISLAADYVEMGQNVLYVTCEMSEEQIGIRFDARFLNQETSHIPKMDEEIYVGKLSKLKDKYGKLIIKEYPTNELTSQKLEVLIDELYTKTGFHPDAVFIDYLGICSSYMLKDRGNIGTYYTKVAEEFRSAAQKKNVAIWTAQQMVTDALDNTDPDIKHIGYGQGIAKTSDMVWFAIRTEEMDKLGQLLIKQVKTRYHKERIVRFNIGFDIGHMRMFEVTNSAVPMTAGISNEPVRNPKTSVATAFNNIGKKKLNMG